MAKRLQDLLQDQNNGWISMAELDAIEAAQRGQPIGQIPGSFSSGQGAFRRSGGDLISLAPEGWKNSATNELVAARTEPDDGRKMLERWVDRDGVIKERWQVPTIDGFGRSSGGEAVYSDRSQTPQALALRQKQEAADLDMQLKRADLSNKQGGNWKINADLGVMYNDRGETKPLAREASGAGQIVPGNNDERLAAGYGQRMALADQLMQKIGPEGYQTTGRAVAESVPFVGGYLGRKVGTEKQGEFSQAQADWVRAKLRKESGAAIGIDEMEKEISTYFPMPGDSPGVVAQKAQARQIANEAMKMAAGRAGGAVTGVRTTQNPAQLMQEAEQAIARGAPREAVMQRLQEHLKGQ